MTKPLAFWLAAATIVAAIAFLTGRSLHAQPVAASAFDLESPAYESARPVAGFSKGGFTGFGEVAGFEGRTFLGGRIVAIDAGSVTLETASGARSTLRIANPELQVIRPASRSDLVPGVSVVIRPAAEGEAAEALLIFAPALAR